MAKFKKGEGGRPKGATNRLTREVKAMVIQALENVGGVAYLERQARKRNPAPFLTLVGKVLPLQVSGDPDAPIVTRVIHEDADAGD